MDRANQTTDAAHQATDAANQKNDQTLEYIHLWSEIDPVTFGLGMHETFSNLDNGNVRRDETNQSMQTEEGQHMLSGTSNYQL